MNKKRIVKVALAAILLISVSSVLVINAYPDLTLGWTLESKSVLKQYIKVIGFLSVMGLVYLFVEGLKIAKQENEEGEKEVDDA
ncbi:MAG: hypothetical protein COC06_04970 [Bacteroidales bacterium]|nr:MAG: hypothetical protein COC06_05715 [Bacteroidales bacterium]PCH70346.1 MAG: hypothetical protein COC06_04970 [Bacteroidales bacterium]